MTPIQTQDLTRLLAPKSIAVVGASRRPGSVGQAIFKNLLQAEFKGTLYPVNPKADAIDGVKCYSSLSQIPDPVDLAILIVPSKVVPSVLRECAAAHIPGAVIITAGFREIGGEGVALEEEIKRIARDNGIALVGPNCLGVMNTDPTVQMNASFAAGMPKKGNIAFLSQSGALCTAVLDYAKGVDIGFSKFVSLGNKAVTNELDFLKALQDDPLTDVILMYVENISDGREFIRLARQITHHPHHPKPILAIKSGRTLEGAQAASSHTGSLAGSDEVYDALFLQSGVMRVESVQDLFDHAVAFSNQPLPKGNRVAIVTNAGGPGIMATDALVRHGLTLAPLEEKTKQELKKVLPITANINNPVDVIGDAKHDRYEAALKLVLKDPNVDAIVVILTPQAMTDIKEIGEVVANVALSMKVAPWTAKPLLASFMGIVDVSAGVHLLQKAHVPHYIFPEAAVRSLGEMVRYQQILSAHEDANIPHHPVQKEVVQKIFDGVFKDGRTYLPEVETLKVLSAYGFPVLKTTLAKKEEEAIKAAEAVGYPVVLKICSPQIVHKVDVGGVAVGLKNSTEVANAFRKILNTAQTVVSKEDIWGVEVQKMADKGLEVFLGAKRDPQFGPVVVFGLGGTFVDVFKDVAFRLAPLRDVDVQQLMDSVKAAKLLKGYRGEPADVDKIGECLSRLSQLVTDFPVIQELDINPLIVYPPGNGGFVVDGRIFIR